jgi:hypothetical protein
MAIILLMWFLQTVHDVLTWYLAWLAFIKHGDSFDGTLEIITVMIPTPTLINLYGVSDFLTRLKLVIADSIMVSNSSTQSGRSDAQYYSGLEVLGHL